MTLDMVERTATLTSMNASHHLADMVSILLEMSHLFKTSNYVLKAVATIGSFSGVKEPLQS